MIERKFGRIVNIGSDAGRVGSSLEAVYSGAKGGIIAFTKTLAREVATNGITVNAVCPGPTDTPALRKFADGAGQDADKVISGIERFMQPVDDWQAQRVGWRPVEYDLDHRARDAQAYR